MMQNSLRLRLAAYSDFDSLTGCWLWNRPVGRTGYARISVDGVMRQAHRVAYELLKGPIPDTLQLDHTCHTKKCQSTKSGCIHRRCINPKHLEPVTALENNSRGRQPHLFENRTHCKNGHLMDEGNTYFYKMPTFTRRICRECARTRKQLWQRS